MIPDPAPVLEVRDAHRSWGAQPALTGVSLDLGPGEIFALIGPNGAGKTTLVRAIAGRVPLDRGAIRIGTAAPGTPAARRAIGLVPQAIALYPFLTARENLETFGRLSGLPAAGLDSAVARALRRVDLLEGAHRLAGQLSGGMQRRLNLAAGVLHDPRLLLLDEPTVGIDLAGREQVHDLLRALRADGVAILLTTHDLDQTTELADRVGILSRGRLVAVDAPHRLIERTFEGDRELLVTLADEPAPPARGLLESAGMRRIVDGVRWTGRLRGGLDSVSTLQARLEAGGARVAELRVREPSLRSVFFQLTGEDLVE